MSSADLALFAAAFSAILAGVSALWSVHQDRKLSDRIKALEDSTVVRVEKVVEKNIQSPHKGGPPRVSRAEVSQPRRINIR